MGTGEAQTVLGPVPVENLGVTLPHEHLFVRIEGWSMPSSTEEEARFLDAPVSMENLPAVHRRALSNRDNCRIDDLDVVVREVQAFSSAGGQTIVDLTPHDLGRDPVRMQQVARATGMNVVAGCGYYVDAAHPPELEAMTVEAIAERLEQELTEGIGESGVRPGVIGEIGTGKPVTPRERKVLRAAALAHQRTGAPISIHLFPAGGTAVEVLDLLEEGGADPGKVVLGHLDGQDPIRVEEHVELAKRGAFVEYDLFGANWSSDDTREVFADQLYWSPPPSDQQRARAIVAMFEADVGEHVLISHDICTKIQQLAWGGPGFEHIPRYVVPFLRANGLSGSAIDTVVRSNPQRWLEWSSVDG